MAEKVFQYEGNPISIQCNNKNQKMKEICIKLSGKINTNINSLIFLYGGNQLNLEKTFNEITKENKISILVYKYENEICSKCGRILNNKIIDEIVLLNNNISYTLIGLKSQIDNIINDLINRKDILFINSQLKNINLLINNVNEDIKKNNIHLNQLKVNYPFNSLNKSITEKKINILKNEIICVYNKQSDEINLLHDYNENIDGWGENNRKSYLEGKNNINEKNIEIYLNNKRIQFNYKYKSNEKGEIKIKFIFNKLLSSTSYMFNKCSSLISIDLFSFNSSNIKDMGGMFYNCSSLKSIDLSSLNTSKVKNMTSMFCGCSSLKSINLTSFNTSNVNDMRTMFAECSSLKSIDLSSFNTINVKDMTFMFYKCSSLQTIDLSSFNTTNVDYMTNMFAECSSLKSIDLSSFNTTNVKYMAFMFDKCSSLKKDCVKIGNFGKNILEELKSN